MCLVWSWMDIHITQTNESQDHGAGQPTNIDIENNFDPLLTQRAGVREEVKIGNEIFLCFFPLKNTRTVSNWINAERCGTFQVLGYQATAIHCNTLQHAATLSNKPQQMAHVARRYIAASHCAFHSHTLRHTATHCNTLQHTATRCNTLQHTTTRRNTLHQRLHTSHPPTHCNTLQRTETHCNILQHTATHCNSGFTLLFSCLLRVY